MSRTQKGWSRFIPLKNKFKRDLALASTDQRLLSLAKRFYAYQTAVTKMNHANGMFLDKSPRMYGLDEMKALKARGEK